MMAGHLRAMWVALTLAAALSAYFVTRLTAGLARRDREIADMRERAARRERLSAVTTLAAGAAHELATPLTTVAVVAGELQRSIAALPPDARRRLDDDVRLIRDEVVRCREILDSIGIGSGSASGEMPARFTAADLLAETRGRLQPDEAARVAVTGARDDARALPAAARAGARAPQPRCGTRSMPSPGGSEVSWSRWRRATRPARR